MFQAWATSQWLEFPSLYQSQPSTSWDVGRNDDPRLLRAVLDLWIWESALRLESFVLLIVYRPGRLQSSFLLL